MLTTRKSEEDIKGIYEPLQKKFKNRSIQQQTFYERQEFSIKFTCMILFALLLIFFGTLVSSMIQYDRDAAQT